MFFKEYREQWTQITSSYCDEGKRSGKEQIMINLGNSILYLSLALSIIALAGLLLKELKKLDILTKLVSPFIV